MTTTRIYDYLNRLLGIFHEELSLDNSSAAVYASITNPATYDSQSDANSGVSFVAYDGNGNVSGLVRGTDGSSAARYEYDPFGQTLRSSGELGETNNIRFSSKYTDKESDFAYYGYRFYNPSMGRWPSRDPIIEQGGVGIYAFCKNEPISNVDVLGREPLADAQKWLPLKGDNPGACQYGDEFKYAANFLINKKCEPIAMKVGDLTMWKPCAIKRFAWPVDCVCKSMSDSEEDQCIRGCLKYKYDTNHRFPTVLEHLDCARH
jgi:RHS repeat-associated protein